MNRLLSDLGEYASVGCLGYAIGYTYGSWYQINSTLSAKAVAIDMTTKLAFKKIAKALTIEEPFDQEKNLKKYQLLVSTGDVVIAISELALFKEMELIGNLGMAIGTTKLVFQAFYLGQLIGETIQTNLQKNK